MPAPAGAGHLKTKKPRPASDRAPFSTLAPSQIISAPAVASPPGLIFGSGGKSAHAGAPALTFKPQPSKLALPPPLSSKAPASLAPPPTSAAPVQGTRIDKLRVDEVNSYMASQPGDQRRSRMDQILKTNSETLHRLQDIKLKSATLMDQMQSCTLDAVLVQNKLLVMACPQAEADWDALLARYQGM
jgi:hypothetical protein